MIGSLALLLGCLAAGEVLAAWTGLPVPGAITGMGILLVGLAVRGSIGPSLKGTAKGLLAHLALLLVPALVSASSSTSRACARSGTPSRPPCSPARP
jgi:holin-like protein